MRRRPRAQDRMAAASREEWPIGPLARVSGVSAAHFVRSLKDAFGVAPHRHLRTRRVADDSAG